MNVDLVRGQSLINDSLTNLKLRESPGESRFDDIISSRKKDS